MQANPDKAKEYAFFKHLLVIIDTAYLLVLLLLFLVSGLSKWLSLWLLRVTGGGPLALPLYLLVFFLAYLLLDFPLHFYQTYALEHRYGLSRQGFRDWLTDHVKSTVVSYVIMLALIAVFYALMKQYIHTWWLAVSVFWVAFSLVLARLVPVVIIPLFFKYQELTDEVLKKRIRGLAEKMRFAVTDVFAIDLSKKTLKANAAFVGWGKTRRVLLADTLLAGYTHDEIEVILAHEFAHYTGRHLLKLIAVNAAAATLLFYFLSVTGERVVSVFGITSLWDMAALPAVLLYFLVFGILTQPLLNYLSRRMERNADTLALRATGLREAFISMMEKLSAQNLSDRNPHPVVKFLFFDHPSVEERIALARNS